MGGRLERIMRSFGSAVRGTVSEKPKHQDTTGIFEAVNQFRMDRGLPGLRWSKPLAEQAMAQAGLIRQSKNLIDASQTDRICFRWPSVLVKSVNEAGKTIGGVALQTAAQEAYQYEILIANYSAIGVGWAIDGETPDTMVCTCVVDFGWE